MAARNRKSPLGQKIRSSAASPPVAPAKQQQEASIAPGRPPASVTTGKPAAVWFDDEDRAILRELSVMVLQHGLDPSHSLLLRALLRVAPRDERLIEQVRELIERDGRKLRHQKPAEVNH
jgi:hypothetical protein